MNHASLVRQIILTDPLRWHILGIVRSLSLPDCWIGAGFIRNAVWDHLHGSRHPVQTSDVDVIWHDPDPEMEAKQDKAFEEALRAMEPSLNWSVKNQARMHARNGDDPYASSGDAIRFWPETATAIAVRRSASDDCDIIAPYGLDDLIDLKLRPTPSFAGKKRAIFEDRVRTRGWCERWPKLEFA